MCCNNPPAPRPCTNVDAPHGNDGGGWGGGGGGGIQPTMTEAADFIMSMCGMKRRAGAGGSRVVVSELEGSEVTAQFGAVTSEQRRRVWVEAAPSGTTQLSPAPRRRRSIRLKVNLMPVSQSPEMETSRISLQTGLQWIKKKGTSVPETSASQPARQGRKLQRRPLQLAAIY